ncbi:MAG: hypothetical protein GVY13_15510 [Alphaproteobacteria bacterium]|jgi:hypothetical protein|nr:hypothetical protein [Alphaproteobacteria bacterium]
MSCRLATRLGTRLVTRLGQWLRARGACLGHIACPGLVSTAPRHTVADRTALRAIGDRPPDRALALAGFPRGIAGRTPRRSIRLCR